MSCQHDPLQPNTTLQVQTHPLYGLRIACLVCSHWAMISRKTGNLRLAKQPEAFQKPGETTTQLLRTGDSFSLALFEQSDTVVAPIFRIESKGLSSRFRDADGNLLHPMCNACGWRKGGTDSWSGRACKCGLYARPMIPHGLCGGDGCMTCEWTGLAP
jgi:hypothetical protein